MNGIGIVQSIILLGIALVQIPLHDLFHVLIPHMYAMVPNPQSHYSYDGTF
jgi:hypothetical protein